MQAIIDLQRPFFLEGDESLLRPMILKDVADVRDWIPQPYHVLATASMCKQILESIR